MSNNRMKYIVHGESIEWEQYRELGFCIRLDEGPVMLRYMSSYADRVVDAANSMSIPEAIKGAKGVLKKTRNQIGHESLKNLLGYRKGILDSVTFYKGLIKVLENATHHSETK